MFNKNLNPYEQARRRYKPVDYIEFLLIGESPPESGGERFFYFENVNEHDNLYKETMRVLYPRDAEEIMRLRREKARFLSCFQKDRFYLIDATDIPINKLTKSEKRAVIIGSVDSLITKINNLGGLINQHTKIILISSLVYHCCFQPLMDNGFNVINESMIPFPLGGSMKKFNTELTRLLTQHGLQPKDCFGRC